MFINLYLTKKERVFISRVAKNFSKFCFSTVASKDVSLLKKEELKTHIKQRNLKTRKKFTRGLMLHDFMFWARISRIT